MIVFVTLLMCYSSKVWTRISRGRFFSSIDCVYNSLTRYLCYFHLRSEGAWMGNFHHRTLMVSASVSAYTAPALMAVCLLTNYWYYGKQIRLSQNPSAKIGERSGHNFTFHRIGLWRECIKETLGKWSTFFSLQFSFYFRFRCSI